MEHSFWHHRWETAQTGFHQTEINPCLRDHWEKLTKGATGLTLVPLCGKSRDLLWLREQGHPVIGVELSPIAVADFFKDPHLPPPTVVSHASGERTTSNEITILCGDFLALQPSHLPGPPAFIYDRASLIALPETMRRAYVETQNRLAPPGSRMLLLSLSYPQEKMVGPPFSVPPEQVLTHYNPEWKILEHHCSNILPESPKFQDRGLTELLEHVFLLEKK